jgi:lipocalin
MLTEKIFIGLFLTTAVILFGISSNQLNINELAKLENINDIESLNTKDDLPFAKDIDFPRFMGVWYNIASLPNIIENKCKCAQTVDTLLTDLVI